MSSVTLRSDDGGKELREKARAKVAAEITAMNVSRPAALSLVALGGSAMTVRLTPDHWRALADRTPEESGFRRYIAERLRGAAGRTLGNVPVVIPREHVAAFRSAYRDLFGRQYPERRD